MQINKQDFYDRAVRFYQQGDFLPARELVEQILSVSPDEIPALSLHSAVLFRLNELHVAQEVANFVLMINPEDQLARQVVQAVDAMKHDLRRNEYYQQYMLKRSRFMNYPSAVSIETTGRCNAACNFCPHPGLERNKGVMSDEMFEKIISDLEQIPKDHPLVITPGVVNEPFMDKKFFPRLQMINERLPQARLTLFSNMNVMPKDFETQIISIRNIDYINVSFNAANANEYEAVMKIKFDRTVKNLKTLMSLNRQHKIFKIPVILSRVSDLTEADHRYASEVRAIFSEFKEGEDYLFKVKNRTNWLNKLDIPSTEVPVLQPCSAWYELYIHSDGHVPHCCMDSDASFSIGHIMKNSVLEIYNGPQFKHLREKSVSRGEAGFPCNQCSLV